MIIVNNKFNGATTVGWTINIASKIGIKFFATGGIGGVHLNSEQTLDVSSDLYELSKNNICVVVFIIGKNKRDITNMCPTPLMSLVEIFIKFLICFQYF